MTALILMFSTLFSYFRGDRRMKWFYRIFNTIIVLVLLLIVVGGGSIYYAFNIEPYRIVVDNVDLNQETESSEELNIVQISDIHIKEDYTYEQLIKIVDKVNNQNPDIVVFTGDLYDNYGLYSDDENIIEQLSRIKSNYGKFAVFGNRDHGGGAAHEFENIMNASNFEVLLNENTYVNVGNGKRIMLTGLDDQMLGNAEMPTVTDSGEVDYKILIAHEPDIASEYFGYDYDFIMSGHSHGGQIKVPFFPKVNEDMVAQTELADKYSAGLYDIHDGKIKMYVNTGLGTTHISARFGVVPEIAVFHVNV